MGLVLIAGLSLFLTSCMGVSGFDTMWRIMWSDDSTIEDYLLFPIEELHASDEPFLFEIADGTARLPATVAAPSGQSRPLLEFLGETDTVASVVVKDDVIIMEEYFSGYDQSRPTLAFSMSKSITSILVGAAIADGHIGSIDQVVTDYVPEMAGAGFDQVTIKQLLQMTSGMDYVEEEGRAFSLHNRFYYTDVLEEEILNLELAATPGESFSYKSGDNALLGLILARALSPTPPRRSLNTPSRGSGSPWAWNTPGDGTPTIPAARSERGAV